MIDSNARRLPRHQCFGEALSETGSAEVDKLWGDSGRELFVSRLSALEIVSVFAGKVRGGLITLADFDALRRRFAADLTKIKRPVATRMLVRHFQEAERLLRQHGALRRLRTLDALQLGVALDLQQKLAVDRFVCADKDLLAVAALEGLATLDPENP
ncbi:MAG: type II toxin-antitoxin system VapC family toxin [Gemmataceae bacterium]|nr:type II toxin-antitoxin system VapC family toxin [Gemmataceae bacterium]